MYAADRICTLPKKALTQRGRAARASRPPARAIIEMTNHRNTIIPMPRRKPAIGEITIGRNTFHTRPLLCIQPPRSCDQISASQLPCEADSAAPHRPPISACEDDEGRPNHHVNRFQPIDRKSTRLNSSHVEISYAVFCLKKKKKKKKKKRTRA